MNANVKGAPFVELSDNEAAAISGGMNSACWVGGLAIGLGLGFGQPQVVLAGALLLLNAC